jgi:hypothetical protein
MAIQSAAKFHDFLKQTWEQARGFLVEDLSFLHEEVRKIQNVLDVTTADSDTIQTLSTTGTQNNFILTDAAKTLIVSTSTMTITGLANPTAGRELLIVYTGSGTLKLSHESSSSNINYRIICPSTNGLIVGTNGALRLVYDGAAYRWRAFTVSAGKPITPTFAAGDFTGSGTQTWTVDSSPDVTTHTYSQFNKQVTWTWEFYTTSVGGVADTQLRLNFPAGFTPVKNTSNPILISDAGTQSIGVALILTGLTFVVFAKATFANWTASANLTNIRGEIIFEVT